MEGKAITIYDIAKEAGVSTATVSRVIAGNYPVSEKTKKKVNSIIKEYNFHPNAVARSLSSKRSRVLGFITPEITNPFFSQVFIEVEKHALEKGYSVLLGNSLNNRKLESKYIRMLLDQQAEGIILLGGLINDIYPDSNQVNDLKTIEKKTKLVTINGRIDGVNSSSVRTDEGKGIEMVVEHLVELGHSKIGIIGGIEHIATTQIKIKAFKQALKKHHLEFKDSWQVYWGYDIESGENGLKTLCDTNKDFPTAIIGINDMVAIGLVKGSRKLNRDFAFVGYDNTDLAIASSPELTSVSHPYNDLGKIAIDLMDKDFDEKKYKDIILDPILIQRESTLLKNLKKK